LFALRISREAATEYSPQPALSLSKGRKPWVPIAKKTSKPGGAKEPYLIDSPHQRIGSKRAVRESAVEPALKHQIPLATETRPPFTISLQKEGTK
jgi:hypothetical protein